MIEKVSPENTDELIKMLEAAGRSGKCLYPGRIPFLPESPASNVSQELSLDKMKAVVEHSVADQVICIESGMSLGELQKVALANNQFFPAYARDPSISFLDLINCGQTGPIEHGYGSLRDLVLGLTVMQPSGSIIKCGGRVVKNVTGYDLTKLLVGARGNFGIVLQAHLRLYANPESRQTIGLAYPTHKECLNAVSRLRRSGLPFSCMEIVESSLLNELSQEKALLPFASEPLFQSYKRSACLLFIQIHGINKVIRELLDKLRSLAGERHDYFDLNPQAEDSFWNILAEPSASTSIIDVCAPLKFVESLLLASAFLDEITGWTARPSKNRLKLLCKNEAAKSTCLNHLQRLSQELGSSITAAASNKNYILHAAEMPSQDPVLAELKQRLKREYDPDGILNPLVCI